MENSLINPELHKRFVQRIFKISVPDTNRVIEFKDIFDLKSYIERELLFWSFLGHNHPIVSVYSESLNRLKAAIDHQENNDLLNATNNLNQFFNNFNPTSWPTNLPPSTTPIAKKIKIYIQTIETLQLQ